MVSVSATRVFVARLAGCAVFDPAGDRVGKVRDVLVVYRKNDPPRVVGLIVEIPGKRVSKFKVPVLENDARVWRDMEEFDTAEGAHPGWPDRFFARIVDGYLHDRGNRGALIGDARSYLVDARGLLDHALREMRRAAQ